MIDMPVDVELIKHLTPAERKELAELLAAMTPYQVFRGKYLRDPAGFVRDCIIWEEGEGPASYQVEALYELQKHRRVSVRGPHGLGKTSLSAWGVLWFALTRDAGKDDWKVPTTASAWRQLTKFLWPEIHKWAHRLKWDKIGREPFDEKTELLDRNLKLRNGEAFPLASNNASMIEGAHAKDLLYIFDEAKEIPPETWDAAEGAFSTGGCFALAISTPGEPNGRFYEIHKRAPGYEEWWVRHVHQDEAIKAGRMSAEWAAARERQWGKESAVFQNRVAGEFASSAEDTVISLASIERSNQRWLLHQDANDWEPLTVIGLDVGRGGDFSVFARRHGRAIKELQRNHSPDTMQVTGILIGILEGHPGVIALVDVLGIGAGVVDRARENKTCSARVIPFVAGGATELKDEAGEMGFINCLTESARIAPIGDLKSVYRSRYEGTLYCVKTSSGDEFTATPNHQVLTRQGWAAVKSLCPGDELCNAARGDAPDVAGIGPEINNMPATIGEVYAAGYRLFGSKRVEASAVNFHGDRPMGDVDIVSVNGNLVTDHPISGKHSQDRFFIRTLLRKGALLRQSLFAQGVMERYGEHRILTVLPSGNMFCRPGLALLQRETVKSEVVGLRDVPGLNTMFSQDAIYNPFADIKDFPQLFSGLAGNVLLDNRNLVNPPAAFYSDRLRPRARRYRVFTQDTPNYALVNSEGSGDVGHRLAGEVGLNEVVSIDIIDSSRHNNLQIYTLETSTGMYCTTNTVHKNCRSAGWWNLRVLLNNDEIDLPPDDNLTGDLTAAHWKPVSGGKIQVESKDDIKKRLGRSTDDGDAVMQAFYSPGRSASQEEIDNYKDNVIANEDTIGADMIQFLKDSGVDMEQFRKKK